MKKQHNLSNNEKSESVSCNSSRVRRRSRIYYKLLYSERVSLLQHVMVVYGKKFPSYQENYWNEPHLPAQNCFSLFRAGSTNGWNLVRAYTTENHNSSQISTRI